jgi:hypothetical protein
MLSRRTFVSDTLPNAGLGLSAVRRIPSGAPGFANAWVLSLAEIDAVRREALPSHADPKAGIVGMGQCDDPKTKRPACPYYAECQRANIAREAVVCRAAVDEADAQAVAEQRRVEIAAIADVLLANLLLLDRPAMFFECCVGVDSEKSLLLGAWRLLRNQGRIVAIGIARPERCKARTTWLATGNAVPSPVPANPVGRKQKHIEKVLSLLTAAKTPMTFREVNAVLDLPGSLASNCLTRMEKKGKLARRKRGDVWEYWIKDKEDKRDANA